MKNSIDIFNGPCYNTSDMQYVHSRTYQLRYTDFDFKDDLKPSSLLGLVQEAACSSADELGFGYEVLKPKELGFIIVNTYCELVGPVNIGDELTVETWPLPPRHVIFERDYRVKNQKGETVALLASRWCLVDLKNFNLLTPDPLGETHTQCPYNPNKSVQVPAWKIPKIGEGGREAIRITVGSSRCDHYFHANNTYYADFFLDCFTMEELARPIKNFQIAYVKQAKEGVELVFFRKDEGNISVCECHHGEELIAQFRIEFGA